LTIARRLQRREELESGKRVPEGRLNFQIDRRKRASALLYRSQK
jgi:hypothetical protein